MKTEKADVVILGAGASGLMCARVAALRGRRVMVLEHNDRVGKKILISGGGRCNFTNLYSESKNFISLNPHFVKSALARFTPHDFLELLQQYEIPYFEKKAGQLFCKTSAKEITRLLLLECAAHAVQILLSCQIRSVEKKSGHFEVQTLQEKIECETLVVATGGLSFQNLGASDLGYRIARQFGLSVTATKPALVPLLFEESLKQKFSTLAGVSLPVRICTGGQSFEESMLFTHRGLSGPAVLQISSYWNQGQPIEIDLAFGQNLPELLFESRLQKPAVLLKNKLATVLPNRLAELWCDALPYPRKISEYSIQEIERIAEGLVRWVVYPAGTEGYAKAEVTRGGVSTDALSSKTLEAKSVTGLYFIGEVVDVTGHLGGHNFQWAWASGAAAGQAV